MKRWMLVFMLALLPPSAALAQQSGGIQVEVTEEEEEPRTPEPASETRPAPESGSALAPGGEPAPAPEPEKKPTVPETDSPPAEPVVTSATRTPQTITEAPAIVTVVTREEILALGYRSLTEVLRNTVGFDVNDNLHWPDTGVRGINDRTTYGDKIQMLLDGHNMSWRQFNRNYHHPGWVAMEDIARVELIRGPGSAIWGANALNGVVNIVTRDWAALDGAEFTFGMDHRFDHQFVSGRAGTTLGEHLKIGASIAYYGDDADLLLPSLKEFRRGRSQEVSVSGDDEQGITVGLRARYRWFSLTFHKIRHETGAPLSTFSVVGGDDSVFVSDRHIARLAFSAMPLRGLDLTAEVSFDDYRFLDGTVYERYPLAPGKTSLSRELIRMDAADQRWEFKVRANYVPSLKLQVMGGVELEYLDVVRWHFPDQWALAGLGRDLAEFQNVHFGAFLQAQYSPVEILAITAGLRLDYDQIYGLVLLYDYVPPPRLGVVLRLPAGVYIKGLAGMAYKAPSFHDLYYFRKDAYYGNPTLEPEQAVTGELQIGYRLPGWLDVRVTGFYSRIDALIGYGSVSGPLGGEGSFPSSQRPSASYNQKTNKAHVSTAGFEAEALITPHRRVSLKLHGSYRHPWDADGERLHYSALWSAGGSLTVRAHRHLQLSLRGLGVGNKKVPARGLEQPGFGCPLDSTTGKEVCWTSASDPTLEAPAYFIGTAVIRAVNILHEGVGLHLKLDNFTDTTWYDAGRDLLYPQRRFQGMLWATLKL